jgi:hypothetical protein
MKTTGGFFVGALISAFMLASPALAQDKAKDAKAAPPAKAEKGKNAIKVLIDNDRVLVQEVTLKPGDEGANVDRPARVIHVKKGGTMQRTWPDGKTDKNTWKDGETIYAEASKPYVPKNIGKSNVELLIVVLKEPAAKPAAKK